MSVSAARQPAVLCSMLSIVPILFSNGYSPGQSGDLQVARARPRGHRHTISVRAIAHIDM